MDRLRDRQFIEHNARRFRAAVKIQRQRRLYEAVCTEVVDCPVVHVHGLLLPTAVARKGTCGTH
eukprot:43973-Eustigmatos_ZCMA.PRE.1